MDGNEQFFYLRNGSTLGPVDRQQLQSLADNKTVVEATPIKLGHDGDWRSADTWGLDFTRPRPKSSNSSNNLPWIAAAAAIGAAAFFFWPSGFSEAEIERVRQTIREEYTKRGNVTVEDVTMIKKSSRELTGFVRLKPTALGVSQTIGCTASMAESGGQYLWRCGR